MRHPIQLPNYMGWLTILNKNYFQNPHIFITDHHVSLFPEQSTLVNTHFRTFHGNWSGIESGTQRKMK
jgi:hypothetical protein